MARARWALQADLAAEWFGAEASGTDSKGRARLEVPGGFIETRTTLRSSAITWAERNKPKGSKGGSLAWAHLRFSRRSPRTIAVLVDASTMPGLGAYLARTWAFCKNPDPRSPSEKALAVGGSI